MTELHAIQTSLVYVESVIELLTRQIAKPPYTFLANRVEWSQTFDKSAADRHGVVQPPWPDRAGRGFWAYYFEEQRPLSAIRGEQAWRAVAPLRHSFPLGLAITREGVRIAPEAFVYPHGLAVVLTFVLRGALTPDEAADAAFRVRRDPCVKVQGATMPLPLDAVAAQALDALRQTAFGAAAPAGRRPAFPFSVTTVVLGKGGDHATLPADGSPEHRFLDAVTTWSPNWRNAALGKVADKKLEARTTGTPAGHLTYRQDHGRAVWFPASFSLPTGQVRTLTCFHRNLVLASLQVESLAGLAGATAAFLDQGGQLTDEHFDAARRAGNVLGRFYGGARSIYRSRSPTAQMDDRGYVSEINAMRAAVGQKALFAPAP